MIVILEEQRRAAGLCMYIFKIRVMLVLVLVVLNVVNSTTKKCFKTIDNIQKV